MNNFQQAAMRKAERRVKKMGIPFRPILFSITHNDTGFDRAVSLIVNDCVDTHSLASYINDCLVRESIWQ